MNNKADKEMNNKDNKKVYEVIIEKDVPVPTRYWSKWSKIIDDMEIGDSIVLPDRRTSSLFCQHGYRRGMKFTVRKQDDNNLRIWRKE
tara:strand:+ start:573 stop:836 length:264 start_codon:yes stop_codon:yes gene_type:complete